jgi:phage-related protein
MHRARAESRSNRAVNTDDQGPQLHQFVKKTEKTPAKELSIARKRVKERKDADA